MQPLRDKVLVTLEKSPEAHRGIVRPDSETPIRRVRMVALGENVEGIEVGKLYLANVLMGQMFGDEQIVLPAKSLLAEWVED